MLDQRGQDLQSATAETNRCFTLQQKLLGRMEPERAERQSTFDRCSAPIFHSLLTSL
jgi:hypothetical protein